MADFQLDQLGQIIGKAVEKRGGKLVSLELDQIDNHPGRRLTATFAAVVDWPHGRRDEVFGVSATNQSTDVWLYPEDPELPGLPRAAYSATMAEVINQAEIYPRPLAADQVRLRMIGYRPRRRAVVRLDVIPEKETFYVKVLRNRIFESVLHRHNILLSSGIPVPELTTATYDKLLVTKKLDGTPLGQAMFSNSRQITGEQIVALLDAMPADVAKLDRRRPWSDSVEHYAEMTKSVAPELAVKLDWAVTEIQSGLADIPPGNEPTHGDFHEGQIYVSDGQITGLLDIDTVGPGRRADDLACLVAHLTTIQNMSPIQTEQAHNLIRNIVPVFDERVDPIELRLRAAAIIISLATGPYRAQEHNWEQQTRMIVNAAVALVRQVA